MELTELQEIVDRHGRNLKQEIGLALSEQEAKDIIKSAVSEVFSLRVVSQRSELLAFRKWQKDNWKDVYLYSNEFMIREFKKANCG